MLKNARRVTGIFDNGLPAAQRAVQPKDEPVQPKMMPFPHCRPDQSLQFNHGIGSSDMRLFCSGPEPFVGLARLHQRPSNEQSMRLSLVMSTAPSSVWGGAARAWDGAVAVQQVLFPGHSLARA